MGKEVKGNCVVCKENVLGDSSDMLELVNKRMSGQ